MDRFAMSKRKTDYRILRSRRDTAMDRPELRLSSTPRQAADGPMSAPVKREDEVIRRMIDAALAEKRNRLG
jgi:hypothetical protein